MIRPRVDADVDAVVAALYEVHLSDGYPTRWPANPAGWLTEADVVGAWVAVADGAIAGHVALEADGHVARLFTSVGARGSGLGARLLSTAAAVARIHGLRPVLDVDTAALPAIRLYEREGWVRVSTQNAAWTRADGSAVRVHSYELP